MGARSRQMTLNDLTPVLFTDATRFCVDFTDRRVRVWRSSNERFAPVCVAYHDSSSWGSVKVWAGICMDGKTDLYIVQNSTLTAALYVNKISDVYVSPCVGAISLDFILMDDNARPTRARVTYEYLQTATIERMD